MEKKMVVLRPETKCLGEVEDGHYGHAVQGYHNDAAHNANGKVAYRATKPVPN